MLQRGLFPILEFDDDPQAFINPGEGREKVEIPRRGVLCFFGDAIERLRSECASRELYTLDFESYYLPVWEITYRGEKMALFHMFPGASVAASVVDELSAMGCEKFVVCGGCGVISDELPVGELMIPVAAVRDEGTSYHYMPPSREAYADEYAVECIERTLAEQTIPYRKVKAWTTDAFYRETREKIRLRREEGCHVVEMEASALMAAASLRGVTLGQILYAGDNLTGSKWDERNWKQAGDVRERVLRLALDCCLGL